ncbi:MAG: hypothetical protein WC887_01030 [Candidatus Paceibacterota bacterium]|jgi:hypothetical protein
MKSITRITASLVALLAPALTYAATVVGGASNSGGFLGVSWGSGDGGVGCSSTICGIGATILYIINVILVPVLFAVAFIMFLYGVAQAYIFSKGDSAAVAKGHQLILWGIIGFAVMISVWGLVNVVSNTFGLSGYYAPELPQSY